MFTDEEPDFCQREYKSSILTMFMRIHRRFMAKCFGQMQELHQEMVEEIGKDTDAIELYDELVAVATRYAAIRAGWQQLSREEKMERDSSRTSCHNSLITHFNMLARYLRMQGRSVEWRDKLGYGKRLNFRYDRKTPRLLSSSRSTLTIHI